MGAGQEVKKIETQIQNWTEFRFIIHVTSWAGVELQRAGPDRVNKIRAVHVS